MSGSVNADPHFILSYVIRPKRFFESDAMLVLEDPHHLFKTRKGSAESTQKGGTSCFGVATTFARKEPCLRFIPSSRLRIVGRKFYGSMFGYPSFGVESLECLAVDDMSVGNIFLNLQKFKAPKFFAPRKNPFCSLQNIGEEDTCCDGKEQASVFFGSVLS
ncbi:hypothetical protein PIB30_045343 [Stylosanthes scabra]|uniref:Uncharacterized protein n=1 Tax=Stylosanthes scabra TaxID=79078 RepID=A0ABU6QGE2_9FABA|nr:hypothetical protein [Stylosanthes scabra]